MSDDARIIAYVDGELAPQARAALEAEAAQNPELAAAIARHAALRQAVAGAWAGVLEEPTPLRLLAAARPERTGWRARMPGPAQWAAMAACLVVGLFVGRGVTERGPLAASPDGSLVARGGLAQALSRQVAGKGGDGDVAVGLSFRTADNRYCRTFASPGDRLAGLACRERDRWAVRMTTAYQPAAAGDYRMAASATPPAVLAAVDGLIAGDPLDAAGEAAARARNWTD